MLPCFVGPVPPSLTHNHTHAIQTQGKPPSYFIVAGLVFTPATVPYLKSEYGKEYDYDAPVSVLCCQEWFVWQHCDVASGGVRAQRL